MDYTDYTNHCAIIEIMDNLKSDKYKILLEHPIKYNGFFYLAPSYL